MSDNMYAERDVLALREHYCRHVDAMTREGLHDKSDIAAELAWRDSEIERLTQLVERAGEPVALIEALRVIQTHHDLGDAIYSVRERVYERDPDYKGSSWDHPTVVEYSNAVGVVQAALSTAPGASHER